MRRTLALLLLPVAGLAQMQSPTESSIARQLEAVQKQREAIRKQAGNPQKGSPTNSFFTAPWTLAMSQSPSLQANCDPMADADIASLIDKAASREGVNPKLVRAVIRQESGFRPCAVSVKGAQGLMQLMPETAEQFRVADPFDPAQNVDGGTKFLKELLAKYSGDLRLTLGAYNAGAGRVSEAGGVPDIQETQDYVTSILNEIGAAGGDRNNAAAALVPGST